MLHASKIWKIALTGVLIGVLVTSALYWTSARNDQEVQVVTSTPTLTTASQEKNSSEETISFVAERGVSILDQLQKVAQVQTKETTYGTLVEEINGQVNGTGGRYWLFFVDGQIADRGADTYITNGGERIEWKFSK